MTARLLYRPSRGKSGKQAAVEDYVEVINHLIKEKGYASQSDVAERLGVSPPSVSSMLRKLHERGYVSHVKYRGVALTDEGKKLAERMEKRHMILAEFFTTIGVGKDIAMEDAEHIEHYLHKETVQKIAELTKKLKGQLKG
ncbi:MAG: iron dependent repressor, metal binding and dimerization domain protein [Conexivisphaerales archaeon]